VAPPVASTITMGGDTVNCERASVLETAAKDAMSRNQIGRLRRVFVYATPVQSRRYALRRQIFRRSRSSASTNGDSPTSPSRRPRGTAIEYSCAAREEANFYEMHAARPADASSWQMKPSAIRHR